MNQTTGAGVTHDTKSDAADPRGRTHAPVLPAGEIGSRRQALALFLPMAARYLGRHLTVGAWLRLRRRYHKLTGRTFYL